MNQFQSSRKVHFVGIKGIAMAALAVWARERGTIVTGSDVEEEFPSDAVLKKAGIAVRHGFSPLHVANDCDLVIYTGAHGGITNIEVKHAIERGIPVVAHGRALGLAMDDKRQISVAGSHGKTTTTAMIATVLTAAGKDPSYAVGCGQVRGLGLPGHAGGGDWFVAEADEYVTDPHHDATPRFLWQHPELLVVTNIDFDHPDVYKTMSDVQEAFVTLQRQQRGNAITIVNKDDKMSFPLLRNNKNNTICTYGVSADAQYRITSMRYHVGETRFELGDGARTVHQFVLRVPGLHNVHNAAASAVTCHLIGIDWETIGRGLAAFGGAKRRFELIGESRGMLFYDDYAHHPHEISATLEAARKWYPNHRITVVFQPHTYSRTKSLLTEFGKCFRWADDVVITDIYSSARETDTLGIDGMTLVSEIKKHRSNVQFTPTVEGVFRYLTKTRQAKDIIIFVGAGDIYTWEKEVMKRLIKNDE